MPAEAAVLDLSPEEVRVIGALAEKQLTTPQQYPLTLNALVLACNQSSNRNPVVSYDEFTVETTLTSLKGRGLARVVHPSHGRSVTRYRQVLEESFALDTRQLALVTVLLLRGAQTSGELRARTDRMAEFTGVGDVEATLDELAGRETPLVRRLARRPGQKEVRYTHLLGTEPDPDEGEGREPAPPAMAPPPPPTPLGDDVARLRDEVATLRRDLDDLLDRLDGVI